MKKNGLSRSWNLQDAKARLSELVDCAMAGKPQIILRRGEPAAAVVSMELYGEIGPARRSLASFLLEETPRADIDFPRIGETYEPRVRFDKRKRK